MTHTNYTKLISRIEELKLNINANKLRLGMALLILPLASFAQIRESVQQTIFYERVSANKLTVPIEGQILIWTDTLRAFDMTWTIKRRRVFKTDGGDKLLEAIMDIKYKDQSATLMVINKRALFMVPGLQDIEMIQLPHDAYRYKF